MPKQTKKTPAGEPKKKRPPSREKLAYTAIPKEYAQILEAMRDSEKYEKRSVSYLTTLAVRRFLQAEGKLDDKGRPLASG